MHNPKHFLSGPRTLYFYSSWPFQNHFMYMSKLMVDTEFTWSVNLPFSPISWGLDPSQALKGNHLGQQFSLVSRPVVPLLFSHFRDQKGYCVLAHRFTRKCKALTPWGGISLELVPKGPGCDHFVSLSYFLLLLLGATRSFPGCTEVVCRNAKQFQYVLKERSR